MTSLAGFKLTEVCTSSAEYAGLGDTVWCQDSCWQHVVASGVIAKGDLVTLTNGGVAAQATTALVQNVTGQSITKQGGIAQYAFADGDRGYVLVGPFEKNPINNLPFVVNCAVSDLQANPQFTTTTPGRIDDATGTVAIQNLALTADTVSGPALTACRAVDRITFAGG